MSGSDRCGDRAARRPRWKGSERFRGYSDGPRPGCWCPAGTASAAVYGPSGTAGLGPVLAKMRDWAFFTNLLGNVEMTLAKTDLRIAECYVCALVAPSLQPLFDTIVNEHDLTRREVLRLTGGSTLLVRHRLLRHTLQVRATTYLEPLHHLQVSLLALRREVDEPDPDLRRGLLRTVNGIAAGMRNTG
jgi:phosphoenolpyruvate carboxylase